MVELYVLATNPTVIKQFRVPNVLIAPKTGIEDRMIQVQSSWKGVVHTYTMDSPTRPITVVEVKSAGGICFQSALARPN